MECDRFLSVLDDLVDGTLVAADRDYLLAHLDDCLACACIRHDFDLIVRLARELRDELCAPPSDIRIAIRAALNITATTATQSA